VICIIGGIFDPVHFGHLRPALDVQQALGVEKVRLVPCGLPAHRARPGLSASQRLELLELAIDAEDGLVIDCRELQRDGPSYMVDTLESLRAEAGEQPVCLALGVDALADLDSWHRWRDILSLCHLVVMQRPGGQWPGAGELADCLERARVKTVEALYAQSAGCVLTVPVTQMAVSSTQIRKLLVSGRSARYLAPTAVLTRILKENWYAD
jgi:nicotinate-nucleotide adenylyltransferase